MRPLRPEIQMIFQDPYSSLNPRHTVGAIVGAPFRMQKVKPPSGVKAAVQGLLSESDSTPSTTTVTRMSSPAASGSASGSPARSRSSPS